MVYNENPAKKGDQYESAFIKSDGMFAAGYLFGSPVGRVHRPISTLVFKAFKRTVVQPGFYFDQRNCAVCFYRICFVLYFL